MIGYYSIFAKEVFADAEDAIDFSDYDRDGDGVREPDGVVDLVILYIPKEFRDAGCNFQGTVYTQSGFSHQTKDSVTIDGNTVPVTINDNIIYVIQRPSFPYLVGVTAHEYGHVMNLPELYDRQGDASAGIGLWGVMGHGPLGWSWNLDDDWSSNRANDLYSGPTPLSVWSRYKVGWITEDNGRLVPVESDTETAATLHDIIDLCISNEMASHSCFAPDRTPLAMQSSIILSLRRSRRTRSRCGVRTRSTS